jgi:DNA polymerase-3 subunit alpha (Gram-positive type)
MKGTLVFLDLETTGLNHYYERIIEIGMVVVKNGKIHQKHQHLVNPGKKIPYGAYLVHGITDEMVKDKPRIHELKPKLEKILCDCYLVTHSSSNFDIHFLRNELGYEFINTDYHINTCKLSRRLDCHCESHSLRAIRKRYGIKTPYQHRALGDALITYKCFKKIVKKHNIKTIREIFKILE